MLDMYEILLLIIVVFYAVLAWRNLRLAIFIFLALLPSYLLRTEFFGFPMTLLELLFVVLALRWLVGQMRDRSSFAFLRSWWLPLLLLCVAATVGIFVSPDTQAALGTWKAYFIEPVIFFLILRTSLPDYDDGERAAMALGLGALFVALFAIIQKSTGTAIPIPWDVEGRVTSLYPYPNAVGLYLAPIILLSLAGLHRAVDAHFNRRVWLWCFVLGFSMAAIIFSKTEAAWVAIPVAFLLSALCNRKYRAITVSTFVLLVLIAFLTPAFREKILLQDYSGEVRRKQWVETVVMLQDHHLTGAGLSGYPSTLEPYHTFDEIEIFQYPHNIILNVWSELGALGVLVLATLAFQTWRDFRLAYRKSSPMRWLAFGCFAALLEMVIHGLVDVPYFKNDLAMFTFALLALLSWSATSRYALPQQE
jgi:O-antigen ligase